MLHATQGQTFNHSILYYSQEHELDLWNFKI